MDELVAQRIKKLLCDASFHETRNLLAYNNILNEFTEITKKVLQGGGQKRMHLIINRVEQLCGNDISYYHDYLDIFRRACI